MADKNKNSYKYKAPKLKDLLKGTGFEEIPKKIFDQEIDKSDDKSAIDAQIKELKDQIKELEKQKKESKDGKKS